MATIPIPFVEEDLDTGDGVTSILMTVGLLIAGFAAFSWSQDVGGYVAQRVNSFIAGLVGVDPTSGEDSGADLV
jgi:hypothetical protein